MVLPRGSNTTVISSSSSSSRFRNRKMNDNNNNNNWNQQQKKKKENDPTISNNDSSSTNNTFLRKRQHQQHQQPRRNITATNNNNNNNNNNQSTTRLCIKNVPSKYTESDLRQYIHEQIKKNVSTTKNTGNDDSGGGGNNNVVVQITDCKILRNSNNNNKSRRIAFVGFASSNDTTICYRILNKAYCQTSKLVVEYAQLPTLNNKDQNNNDIEEEEDANASSTKKKEQQVLVVGEDRLKTITQQQEKIEKKKQEFLSVMGISTTTKGNSSGAITTTDSKKSNKFWSNDDDNNNLGFEVTGNPDTMNETSSSSSPSSSSTSTTSKEDENDDMIDNNDDADPLLLRDKNNTNKATNIISHHDNVDDDLNFLRSKQVQIMDFDLVDDDDNNNNKQATLLETTFKNKVVTELGGNDRDSHSSSSSSSHDDDDESLASSSSSSSDDEDNIKKIQQTKTSNNEKDVHNVKNDSSQKSHYQDENEIVDDKNVTDHNLKKDTNQSISTSNNNNINNNRIFLRNLPFTATEDDIREHLESCGTIEECHIPIDDQKRSKGIAFVTFVRASDATLAIHQYDGRDFQGRLLHIIPARANNNNIQNHTTIDDDNNDQNLTYKEKMERKRQQDASKTSTGWLASYVRGDAVIDNLATRLGLRKGDILAVKDGMSAGDAAVRLALGETSIIEENRKYFEEHGIDMEALVSFRSNNNTTDTKKNSTDTSRRSKTSILVKNLPHETTIDDLIKMFSTGTETPLRILLPPSRTIAVVEYSHPNDAKQAFKRSAYRRFKNVPLYLEWGPLAASIQNNDGQSNSISNSGTGIDGSTLDVGMSGGETVKVDETADETDEVVHGVTSSIYVKNLNFATNEDQLMQFFSKDFKDVRAVRIPKKATPIKRVRKSSGDKNNVDSNETRLLSMGFGFVEFGSSRSVQDAIKMLQGAILDGHALDLKPSLHTNRDKSGDTASVNKNQQKQMPTKLMVRNVPFQASRKELLQLFGSFGQLKKVRLPKKFDGSHRGFAFIEYLTANEAAAAMQTLSRTHLYGRHLVLEWASNDDENNNAPSIMEQSVTQPLGKKIRFE